jgi:hypothetical protein
MNWEIRLPVRDEDEIVGTKAILELPDLLDSGEDADVIRELLIASRLAATYLGKSVTVGLLGQWLGTLEPGQRRRLLDLARHKAGLPTSGEVEQAAVFDQAQRAGRARMAESSSGQVCAADGCRNVPIDGATGIPTITDAKRWWCPDHRHRAADGDMEPRPSPLRMAPSGAGFVDVAEAEAEEMRQAADARRRAFEREQKLRERAAEAAERDEYKRAMAEAWRPDNLIGS